VGGVTPIIPTILTGMLDPCGGQPSLRAGKTRSQSFAGTTPDMRGMTGPVRAPATESAPRLTAFAGFDCVEQRWNDKIIH
jgi:hypothetical protein